jgi:hypothetical protein
VAANADQFDALLARLAGSRRGNPALLPAQQLAGDGLPEAGVQSVGVLNVGNDETIGGGCILLRSPYAWVTWAVEEGRNNIAAVRQVARTGPFCIDVVHVTSAATVTATVARYWDPTVDPVVDALTGVVTDQTPNPDFVAPASLQAIYIPDVTPAQLRRAAFSLYFADGAVGVVPFDGPGVPVTSFDDVSIPYILAYPVDLYRRVTCRSSLALAWYASLPGAAAPTSATATLVGPAVGQNIAITATPIGTAGNGIVVTAVGGLVEGASENVGARTVTVVFDPATSTTTSLVATIAGAGLTQVTAAGAGVTLWSSPAQDQSDVTHGGVYGFPVPISDQSASADVEASLYPGQWGVVAATNDNDSSSNATLYWES